MAEDGWSDLELEACLRAYLEMLGNEIAGQPVNKAEINRLLRAGPLYARSKGSVEFRMQNISAFMQVRGEPYVAGYKPRANVGSAVLERLDALYGKIGDPDPGDFAPTDDSEELTNRAERLRAKASVMPPAGNTNPSQSASATTRYVRSPVVVAYVLAEAGGTCECCAKPAPFVTDDGEPFLEVHHVKPLADGGPDTVDNAVAVCPNCHRACHYAAARSTIRNDMLKNVARLVAY